MSENLKVNANSSVLEHKRKHNLLVDKANQIPNVSTTDAGKILGVNEQGKFVLRDVSSVNSVELDNIYDESGNKRFLAGNITLDENFKGELSYGKWTLSGSHLMLVCMFKVTESFTAVGTICGFIPLPQWIYNKIYPMGNTNHVAVIDDLYGYFPNNLSRSTGSIRPYLVKDLEQVRCYIVIEQGNLEADKFYRIVFDLVID